VVSKVVNSSQVKQFLMASRERLAFKIMFETCAHHYSLLSQVTPMMLIELLDSIAEFKI
jgi:hypothetical protein